MTEFLSIEPIRLLVYLVGIVMFVALNAAYLTLLERKAASWFQRRLGPTEAGPRGLLQPIADGIKLAAKQIIVPDGVDRLLFMISPVMVSVPVIMNLSTIPFSETVEARNINLGLLMVLSFTSFNAMGIMFGGWASRNKYSVISAVRVVAQNVAYEIPLFLIAISLVILTHTFDLKEIVLLQSGGFWRWNLFNFAASPLMPVACLIFFVCLLAETNRSPFDMMEAESELIAGAITEYSGMGFGLFFISEYANIVVGSCLVTILFLGGWGCPFGLFPGLLWFLVKMYCIIFVVIWIRWSFPRIQFYGLLNLSWEILIPL
ncbi:MAG: NADH-quinone oxidoreductase subunit H, partial [Syntrophales bacterium]|nr:NADH-quinone oxidoreductase subunit H [Syntrophales bacterium]